MARRRRLTETRSGAPERKSMDLETRPAPVSAPAPIAQLAGDAAASSALDDLAETVAQARAEGRFAQPVPLDRVVEDYLVRDRLAVEADALDTLQASLVARGQQVPIEVVDLGDGRFGLISGWRRLTALRRLHAETGEARFATVLAVLRQPETAAAAYLAMVEENEVRAGLSYYERARIVARAVEQGAYPTEKAGLQGLFATASRPRRSKIGAFLRIYHQLDGALRFPAALGERLGLALSRALEDQRELAARITEGLAKAPPPDAAAEAALLQEALRPTPSPSDSPAPAKAKPLPSSETLPKAEGHPPTQMTPGVMEGGFVLRRLQKLGPDLELRHGLLEREPCVILRGPAVDDALLTDLQAFLATRTPS